jgi:glycosyltransferase involved in cell wall biosynthesis
VRRSAEHCDLVVVVDDGSEDGTSKQLARAPATVLRNNSRLGKAASLWRGIAYALEQRVDAIVTMDGDGQHTPEDIPALVAAAMENPGRIIIAARLRKRECMPPARKFGNGMADFWISWAAGYPICDTQSGFRLYPTRLLKALDVPHDPEHGFVFESEVLIESAWLGHLSTTVAVDCVYQKSSRASHYRPTRDTIAIIRMVAVRLIRRGMHPLGLLRSVGVLPTPSVRAGNERHHKTIL